MPKLTAAQLKAKKAAALREANKRKKQEADARKRNLSYPLSETPNIG